MSKRLYRSDSRALGGVCAGMAEYLGWDITITRVAFLFVSILSAAFPGTLIYIILWIAMPEK